MKRNFQFDGFSVIRWGGRFIDLHNAYDLEALGTDLNGTEVTLRFSRNRYAIEPDSLSAKVSLRCTGNVKTAFNNLNEIAAPPRDEGIEIAYFDEGCDWVSFTDEQIAARNEPQGLHISFINGFILRVYCDLATFEDN
ncbi:MAG TPA: hypothetical protein VH331_15015 [Allosphingosinicella sp.]|jgi:hypothetical protein|nr:hypothetical protein [Allosphingosinicella sp.]